MVTYNTPTPGANKLQGLPPVEPEAEVTSIEKKVVEDVTPTPQNPNEAGQETASLPSHDLPEQKEAQDEGTHYTEVGEIIDTEFTNIGEYEELTTSDKKQESKGLISPHL